MWKLDERFSHKKVLFSKDQISRRIKELADQITKDYQDSDELICVCVLRGGVSFFSKLMDNLPPTLNITWDFIRTKSYGDGETSSNNQAQITADLQEDIHNKDVLIIEDIVDTGQTLHMISQYLLGKDPKSLKICCMLNKPSRRVQEISVAYVGFEVPDVFIYGMGLDPMRQINEVCFIDTNQE